MRIKATPSDLPFKFTGFATYPVPLQLGQSSGFTPLPLIVEAIVRQCADDLRRDCFALRNPNKPRKACHSQELTDWRRGVVN